MDQLLEKHNKTQQHLDNVKKEFQARSKSKSRSLESANQKVSELSLQAQNAES